MSRDNGQGAGDLAGLAAAIACCRICRDRPEGGDQKALPHEPHPVAVLSNRARILIAGQAPGLRVHQTGLPFNDPSGDRLRDWLGVDRDQFYNPDLFAILPMGFCFPGYDAHGSDLPPRRECAPAWRATALAAMPQIRLVLAIGAYGRVTISASTGPDRCATRWRTGGPGSQRVCCRCRIPAGATRAGSRPIRGLHPKFCRC